MMLKKCPKCKKYTMEEICKKCKIKTINPHPPKFSPSNKYGKYRRVLKDLSK